MFFEYFEEKKQKKQKICLIVMKWQIGYNMGRGSTCVYSKIQCCVEWKACNFCFEGYKTK